jgi:hypothetical protein
MDPKYFKYVITFNDINKNFQQIAKFCLKWKKEQNIDFSI